MSTVQKCKIRGQSWRKLGYVTYL